MKRIKTTKGQIVLVDVEDYEWLIKYKWHTTSDGYTRRTVIPKSYLIMHREIMKAKKGQYVDHIDGNKSNNQKSNLRFCTLQQNHCNRKVNNPHGLKGVSKTKYGKWQSKIEVKSKTYYLGSYSTKEEAHQAYRKAATKHFGSFANLGEKE